MTRHDITDERHREISPTRHRHSCSTCPTGGIVADGGISEDLAARVVGAIGEVGRHGCLPADAASLDHIENRPIPPAQFGRVGALVSNAGGYSSVPQVEATAAQLDRMIDSR